ncbi:hemerythrin domain-containing protein [Marinobacter salicampi]|uniref:hemerythrin domain-containing protein n=1 Tax=Marinobacter salicampi TaxID=435907 RepID=UPI00140CA731|nr:hemerythrin domain-containing protein [Marinobacter salicampi]
MTDRTASQNGPETTSTSIDDHAMAKLDTDSLLGLITDEYHAKHTEQLEELHRLARKVEVVHREHADAPHGLTRLIKRFEQEYLEHLEREREHVFAKMAGDQPPQPSTPISQMITEHEVLNGILDEIRALTDGYRAPEGACRSWQRLFNGLQDLDLSLTTQVHLEQDVLYPRFQF